MLLGIFGILFLLIVLLSGMLYAWAAAEKKEEAEVYLRERADYISEQIHSVIQKMDSVSSQLLASQTLQKMFLDAQEYSGENYFDLNQDDRKIARDILWTFNSPVRQIQSINIFSESSYVGLRYSPRVSVIQEIAGREQWNVEEEKDGKYKVLGPHKDEWESLEEKNVISLARPFTATAYQFQQVGVIEVQENSCEIEEILENSSNNNGVTAVVFDQNGTLIFPRDMNEESTVSYDRVNKLQAEEIHRINEKGQSWMEVHKTVESAGWTITLLQEEKSFLRPVRITLFMVLGMSMLVMAVVFVILFVTIRNMTRPILQFAEDMDQVKEVDQVPVLHECGVNEITLLQNKYMQLMERMKESKDKLLLASETELQLRVLSLQEQVNPHFLFNSLTAISSVSMEEGGKTVPIMCYQLSELFRYTSEQNTHVTLLREIEYLETYLAFMKWRYEDHFIFKVEKEGDLEAITIPRMIFQPLAENAFTHGFKTSRPPYHLRVLCRVTEDGWTFEIEDNGSGFSEDKLSEIQKQMQKIDVIMNENKNYAELKTEDMAILNIYIRMKLKYRQKFQMQLSNKRVEKGAYIQISVVHDS